MLVQAMTPEQKLEARTAKDARRLAICGEIEALIADVRETHPKVLLHALPLYLQEPARGRLVALLEETAELDPMNRSRSYDAGKPPGYLGPSAITTTTTTRKRRKPNYDSY